LLVIESKMVAGANGTGKKRHVAWLAIVDDVAMPRPFPLRSSRSSVRRAARC